MATNSYYIDLILNRLTRPGSPALRPNVLVELNECVKRLERGAIKPWFLEYRHTGSFTPGQDYIDLPADFLEEVEEGQFKFRDSSNTWHKLTKVDHEFLEAETEDLDPGLPQGYALFGDRFYLGPAPLADYAYKFQYHRRTGSIPDTAVEATNRWLLEFPDLLTFDTAVRVARTYMQGTEGVLARLEPEQRRAHSEFLIAVESRKHVNRDYLLDNVER